ncbi:MAG: amidohydrolase [Bacteroidota bacterium]
MIDDLRIGLVQMDLAWEDPAANRERATEMLAGQEGKHDLVVLPEMFATGFSMEPARLAETMEGDSIQWMQATAARLETVVVGSLIIEEEGQYFNRLLIVSKNGVGMHYDKRHLFRMAGEHQVYRMGTRLQAFGVKGWRICPQICYDLRFPVWTRNYHEGEGRLWYDAVIYVANWPAKRAAHWNALLKARAIENQAYAIGVNRVGTDGNGIEYSGDSAILDYQGRELDHGFRAPRLLTASLAHGPLHEYRQRFPAWLDADQYELKD